MAVEREVKLGAWAGFELPPLDETEDGLTQAPIEPRTLNAVYYDTPDLRLARWGVTVRRRSGDGGGWTVKLPEAGGGAALVRREIAFEGPSGRLPAAALDLVRAYVRRERLAAVAHMRTRRTGVELLDGEGQVVAEVVDDEVSVLHAGRVAARFREVEVELRDRAGPDLADAVVEKLRAAGAGQPDPTPKVVRALGARALAPPELAPVPVDHGSSMADVCRAALSGAVTRILRHDPGVRLGDDPEDVHQARVGTRRLRSDLRTFAPVLIEEWAEPLREELGWVAGLLGGVRDADVLAERLRRQAEALPERDAAGLAPLFRRLTAEREESETLLKEALSGDRYIELLERLVSGAREPALRPEADQPASELLPHFVGRPWRQLRAAVRRLPAEPPVDALHEVRIRAKRVRYAAEAAAPVMGKQATAFAKAVAGLQGVLGDHQDAVVAEGWLRRSVARATAAQAVATGELVAVQRSEAAGCRRDWPDAWRRIEKKQRSWLV